MKLRREKRDLFLVLVLFLFCSPWHIIGEIPVQRHNREAITKLEAFDFNGSVRAFQAALAVDPNSLVVQFNLGLALFYVGDLEGAKLRVNQVLTRALRDPYAHFLNGMLADREGRTREAFEHFGTVLELVPDDPGALYHLGLISLRDDQFSQAITLFERSLEGNPSCTASLYNLGRALIASGRTEEGRTTLKRFQELQNQRGPGQGGGMGDPTLIVGKYGQPRVLSQE